MRKLIQRLQDGVVYGLRSSLGFIAGFAALAAGGQIVGSQWAFLGAILVTPFFSLGAIVVHEFGHAAGARLAGMRVNRIVVADFAWSPKTRKWSAARRPPDASDIGGWVEASEGPRGASRMGDTLFVLGGPLANILASVICVLPATYLPSPLAGIFGGFVLFSMTLALANLIPSRMNGAASDGLQLWRIWRPHRRRKPPKPSRSGWKRTPDF
ncbi:MAG TPA: M50 family metallopeptidase [Hyphomonadaceae bacterium]|jgi:hypothetical protein|nr:M50 family metallopeptidase [Hyphomonadaceae bacterium]